MGQFPLKLVNQIQLFIFNTINSVSFLFRRHIITGRGEEREEDFFSLQIVANLRTKRYPLVPQNTSRSHKRRLTSKSHSRTQFPNANHNLQMLATDASVYLFILDACLCPFGRPVKFETKRENPFFLRHVEQCVRPATASDICTVFI